MFSRGAWANDQRQPRQDGEAISTTTPQGTAGWMLSSVSNVFTRVRDKVEETISPRVVRPSSDRPGKTWESSSGVITAAALTHFELISLNAMEERVLPPDVRIKIVFAQANAVDQDEELLDANVKRLDGLVRTLALYAILERNVSIDKAERIAPDRERELGKMLVAAVQVELFQMLDDICEAGDVENELFYDLCTDTIQEGRRTGFILLTSERLLSPGSGYKRLLQLRKDQLVEDIADVAGLRTLGGHDCQQASPSASKPGSPPRGRIQKPIPMDGDNVSPGSAAGGPGLRITRSTRSESTNVGGGSPSPSSLVPASPRSASPEMGHRRTQTQRVRDLLSTIDKLVMESDQPDDTPPTASSNDPHGNGEHVGTDGPRRSIGAGEGRGGGGSSVLALHSPSPGTDVKVGAESAQRVFFSNEGDRPLAPEEATVAPAPAHGEAETKPASADELLAEVSWLIAETNAALGDDEDDRESGKMDSLEVSPDMREPSPMGPFAAELSGVSRVAEEVEREHIAEADPIGHLGLDITPDKREVSPERVEVPAPFDVTRVSVETSRDDQQTGVKQERVKAGGAGRAGDAQPVVSSVSSPEKALTASPSPEKRVSNSSSSAAGEADLPAPMASRLGGECLDDSDDESDSLHMDNIVTTALSRQNSVDDNVAWAEGTTVVGSVEGEGADQTISGGAVPEMNGALDKRQSEGKAENDAKASTEDNRDPERGELPVGRKDRDQARSSQGAIANTDSSDWSAESSDMDNPPTIGFRSSSGFGAIRETGKARSREGVAGSEAPGLVLGGVVDSRLQSSISPRHHTGTLGSGSEEEGVAVGVPQEADADADPDAQNPTLMEDIEL